MLNKTNILVIFILFTIGCVSLPETTAENIEESPTATIDIDATVMAMFEASNSNETVKKAPPADTQVNITSTNAEQAVSVNLEATIEALRKELLPTSTPWPTNTPVPTPTMLPTSTPVLSSTPLPTPSPTPTYVEPEVRVNNINNNSSFDGCIQLEIVNTNALPIGFKYQYTGFDEFGLKLNSRLNVLEIGRLNSGQTALTYLCEKRLKSISGLLTSVYTPNPLWGNPPTEWVQYDPDISFIDDLQVQRSTNKWDFTHFGTGKKYTVLMCLKVVWTSRSNAIGDFRCTKLDILPKEKKTLSLSNFQSSFRTAGLPRTSSFTGFYSDHKDTIIEVAGMWIK